MGWDISYHPFSKEEVQSLYFDPLHDFKLIPEIVNKFNIEDFLAERLSEIFSSAKELGTDQPFNKGHGFHIAVVSGIIRKYWYTRGSAFSFLVQENPELLVYTTPWEDFVDDQYSKLIFDNMITENYCTGVFLPHEGLKKLRTDYDQKPAIKESMDQVFSHNRLDVFWKAVDYAIDHGFGLIEATEVIEPHPFDLNKSTCYSNLLNCDLEGPMLFQKAALEQMAEVSKQESTAKKKGFFARLFNK